MKSTLLALLLLAPFAAGCGSDNNRAPAAPRGVYSVTGDHKVTLYWLENTERDLDHYEVYYSVKGATGPYNPLASTRNTSYVDSDVQNGSTYWYAVTAVSSSGRESELSTENVHDTPRPEGRDLEVFNAYFETARHGNYESANGIHFATFSLVGRNSGHADVYYLAPPGHNYLVAGSGQTGIQDAGVTTGGISQYDFAPTAGWLFGGQLELVPQHTYVIWTDDDHYAKVFVKQVTTDSVVLDWAYQVDKSNRELKVGPPAQIARASR